MPPISSTAIEQCKQTIATFQAELKRLEEAARPKPRNGDIVRFDDDDDDDLRIIIITTTDILAAYDRRGNRTCSGQIVGEMYAAGHYTVIGNVFDLGPALVKEL